MIALPEAKGGAGSAVHLPSARSGSTLVNRPHGAATNACPESNATLEMSPLAPGQRPPEAPGCEESSACRQVAAPSVDSHNPPKGFPSRPSREVVAYMSLSGDLASIASELF